MEKEIEILKQKYKTYKKVAERIGITPRHLLNLRKEKHVGVFLANHIKKLAK